MKPRTRSLYYGAQPDAGRVLGLRGRRYKAGVEEVTVDDAVWATPGMTGNISASVEAPVWRAAQRVLAAVEQSANNKSTLTVVGR